MGANLKAAASQGAAINPKQQTGAAGSDSESGAGPEARTEDSEPPASLGHNGTVT